MENVLAMEWSKELGMYIKIRTPSEKVGFLMGLQDL